MFDMKRNLARLSELLSVLKEIPPSQFSLETWIHGYSYKQLREFYYEEKDLIRKEKFLETKDIKEVIECGTVACAMGWAALYEPFSNLGFRFKIIRHLDPCRGHIAFATLVYKDSESWGAVTDFFGLTLEESFYLFDYNSYVDFNVEPTLLNVLLRMEAFLQEESGYSNRTNS